MWVEEKEEEGERSDRNFSSAGLFFRSQLTGTRIIFIIVINYSS